MTMENDEDARTAQEEALEFNRLALQMVSDTEQVLAQRETIQEAVRDLLLACCEDFENGQSIQECEHLRDCITALGHLATFCGSIIEVSHIVPTGDNLLEEMEKRQLDFETSLRSFCELVEAEDTLAIVDTIRDEMIPVVNAFFPIFDKLEQIMRENRVLLAEELEQRKQNLE